MAQPHGHGDVSDPSATVTSMRAMVLGAPGEALRERELPSPDPGPGQVRVSVGACGICRTDLHVVDGDLPDPLLPLVLGHQVVGVVDAVGEGVEGFRLGLRVGVPWLGWTCGACRACRAGRENLCPEARFTGYQLPGGFAEAIVADARSCLPIPDGYPDLQAAPLLCAGLIGWRCLKLAGEADRLGIYGFGAAAHLVAQVARWQGRELFAFTRPGDERAQSFARELGCAWAGGSDQAPPVDLDAAILFAAAGELVPRALAAVAPGGTVVCGEIHMSDIPSFPYELLWRERVLRSVANLTYADGREFLELAPRIPVRSHVTTFPLARANDALASLRAGEVDGAIVLQI
jgi:propanol-preferring alcohol dehydrogenase